VSVPGVDYAFPPIPTAAQLVAAGKRFACRYGGPGSSGKQATLEEINALTGAGIAIVANAEGASNGLLGGYNVGVDWAQRALSYFRRLGMPAGRPIYLSVDFDAQAGDWPALDAAMRGAASVLGVTNVGVYGGYDTVRHFVGNGLATWYWQTYAWSAGKIHPSAHIYQRKNGVSLGSGTVDLNDALVNDYGQWGTDMPITDDDAHKIAQAMWLTPVNVDTGEPQKSGYVTLDEARDAAVAAQDAMVKLAVTLTAISATLTAMGATLKTLSDGITAMMETLGNISVSGDLQVTGGTIHVESPK
jgi:hypothetical protein